MHKSQRDLKRMEDTIRPAPSSRGEGNVFVRRRDAEEIADTLKSVREQIEREIDNDPKPQYE